MNLRRARIRATSLLSKSSADEIVDDDGTNKRWKRGGTPALLLTPLLVYGSVIEGVHYKNFPTWKDAFENILAGIQVEWPGGFQIFDNGMVRRGGHTCTYPLQELLIHDHHSFLSHVEVVG